MYIPYKLALIFFLISLFLFYLIIKLNFYKSIKAVSEIQDIHIGNPSRLGGLLIYLLFSCYIFTYERQLTLFFFISLILILPAILEDLRINIKPYIRFLIIMAASFLMILNFSILPQFDLGFLNAIFNNKIFQIIFFTLALATVVNGQNIIDGTNGLSALTIISIFSCILYLGFHLQDQYYINIAIIINTLIFSFLIFNYPFGKIFLGDSGSYFLGFLGGFLAIDIFSKYPEIPSWSAVIILFYPTMEVIFSYFRKIIQKKSPFLPDNLHLHLKIYFLISYKQSNSRLFNALVTPFLGVVWLSPLALLPFSLQYPHWALLIVFGLVAIYLFFYYSIPNPRSK